MQGDALEHATDLGVVYWTWDLESDHVNCPGGSFLFGMTSGPATEFLRAMHEADALLVGRWQQSVRKGGPTTDHRFRVYTPTGLRAVLARARRRGDVVHGVCLDLGEDRDAEIEADKAARAALDRIDDAFTVLRAVRDTRGQIVDFAWQYANHAAARMLGYMPERLVGSRLLDLLPGNRETLLPVCRDVVETGLPHHAEFRYDHDGIRGWFENHTVRVGDGIAVWFREITARKRAEEELSKARERFRGLSESTSTALLLASSDHVYIDANPAFCALLGVSRDEVIGASTSKFVPPGLEERGREVRRALEETGLWTGEFPLVRSDGSIAELRWRVTAITEGQLAVIDDITEEKRAGRQRDEALALERAARTLAEQEARRRDEFISIVSHELRSPLNVMLGWSKMLRSTPNVPPATISRGLEAIERNALAQARMLADLIDLARLDRGKLSIDPKLISLVDLVNKEVEARAPEFTKAGVALDVDIRTDNAWVLGDATRLSQVLSNLLSNALKFTPRGRRVAVRVTRLDEMVELRVDDEGKGLPPEMLTAIFERFRQVDSSTARHHGGLGLGLAIVRQLVMLHRGAVRAESEGEGCGASFIVTLPLAPTTPNAPAIVDDPLPSLVGVRLLVVDDSDDSRDVVRVLLAERGAEVLEANGGHAALALLQSGADPPDAVLCDIGMPGMDGFSFVRAMRAMPGYEQTPTVAVTAFTSSRESILSAGFDAHVAKPVDPYVLVRTIASMLMAQGERRSREARSQTPTLE